MPPSADQVWQVLPPRMPGMVPSVVAVRFPGAELPDVLRVLEQMVAAGRAIRTTRRGHDVYYRGVAAELADPKPAVPDLFDGLA